MLLTAQGSTASFRISRETLANNGRGSYLGWSKAAFWKFESGICTLYDSDKSFTPDHIIISLKVV